VVMWDIAAGREQLPLPISHAGMYYMAWSPDGKRLATLVSGGPTPIKIWQATTGKEILTLPVAPDGCRQLAWSPDGNHLAAGGAQVQVWDLTTGKQKTMDPGGKQVDGMAWSPDGRRLASGYGDVAKVWEVATGKEVLSVPGACNPAWSPDGTRLAAPSPRTSVSPASRRLGRMKKLEISWSLRGNGLVTRQPAPRTGRYFK
jgi:WD40 repeat protein